MRGYSMDVPVTLTVPNGTATVVTVSVEYDFTSGSPTTYSPMYGACGGDAPQVDVEFVWWPFEKTLSAGVVHLDHFEMPGNEVPVAFREALEIYIAEHHDDSDYGDD